MRPYLLFPILVIVPFAAFLILKMITGEHLSAVVLGLTLFVTVAAWFAGPSASSSHTVSRRS